MSTSHPKKAVVLLSGGLDSATCLQWMLLQGYAPYALTFDYGQRHGVEIEAAVRLAKTAQVPHRIVRLPLQEMLHSSLTGHGEIPKNRSVENSNDIPSTYVPARNIIFLSIALGYAESIGAHDIFFGANHLDYSGYPDCRPEFIAAFENMAQLGMKTGVEGASFKIQTPLLHMTKAQIVRKALEMGVDIAATHSCYDPKPDGTACGVCDSCQLRAKGISEAEATL